MNLDGRIYREDGISSHFVHKDNVEERLIHSLKGTELDVPLIRIGCRENTKILDRKGWNLEDFVEPTCLRSLGKQGTVEELLQNGNYSIRTGHLENNIYMLVLDYDNKGEWSHNIVDLSQRLLKAFKGYYIVKTSSKGFHIYVKVTCLPRLRRQVNLEKIPSCRFVDSKGIDTQLELLAQGKKAMGPGSMIDGKIYKGKGKEYHLSNSLNPIDLKDFFIILKKIGVSPLRAKYRERESGTITS